MVDGRTRYRTLRSEPPLLLRPTGGGLLLVGGAAGPLGGDDLMLELIVETGAELVVRSAAASMALPGSRRSRLSVRAQVGERARLDFAPEPLVSVAGGDHQQRAYVELSASSILRWREITVFGRSDEEPGRLDLGLRVERDGQPLVHQDVCVGPKEGDGFADYRDPAVLGGRKVMLSELFVDPALRPEPPVADLGGGNARLSVPVAAGARMETELGNDLAEIRKQAETRSYASPEGLVHPMRIA